MSFDNCILSFICIVLIKAQTLREVVTPYQVYESLQFNQLENISIVVFTYSDKIQVLMIVTGSTLLLEETVAPGIDNA